MLKPINLSNELNNLAAKQTQGLALLDEVNALLANNHSADEATLAKFTHAQGISFNEPTSTQSPLLVNKVYGIETIKQVCLNFRLRFLPASLYKGQLPYEAIKATQAFEQQHNLTNPEYHIVAPAEFFQLKDEYADPLLFAKIGGGYVLIHQWGTDFKPTTKWLSYPWQNLKTAAISAAVLSGIVTVIAVLLGITPAPMANPIQGLLASFPIFLITAMFIVTVGLIYSLVSFKDLSENTWDSKYYN